jgi:hypothetical protein
VERRPWTEVPSSVRSAACWGAILERVEALWRDWSRTRSGLPASGWNGRFAPSGTTGPPTARAATEPTSATGHQETCGSQLTQAEAAFRIQKSDLSLRPVWHHRQERTQARILVCFLACVMCKTLEQWQKRAGLGNGPRTISPRTRPHPEHRRRAAGGWRIGARVANSMRRQTGSCRGDPSGSPRSPATRTPASAQFGPRDVVATVRPNPAKSLKRTPQDCGSWASRNHPPA